MRNSYDQEKAVEVLVYVAPQLKGDVYSSLKAVYHAEKYHLENFGSKLYGDDFAALNHGPVPSRLYDFVKSLYQNPESLKENIAESFCLPQCNNEKIVVSRAPDYDEFSKSDIEALDFGVAKCANKNFGTIKDESHDDAYNATSLNTTMSTATIVSTLQNGDKINQYLKRNDVDEFDHAQD